MDSFNNMAEGFAMNALAVKPSSSGGLSKTDMLPQPGLAGRLIINADDWGYDEQTTNRTLDCFNHGALSSASGMVFMQDSERAAKIAVERGLDIGLHLNLSSPFSSSAIPAPLANHHQKVRAYLRSNRFAQLVYHPGLENSFEYVVARQFEEFARLYGTTPDRIDGHHHMHLCANVLFARLLPAGTMVRRNLSFAPGEKSWMNLRYRRWVDRKLAARHTLTDHFFSLSPVQPESRLRQIFLLAQQFLVEVEAHPVIPEEQRFLCGGGPLRLSPGLALASRYSPVGVLA